MDQPPPTSSFNVAYSPPPPAPAQSMETVAKFMVLLNERWPIVRTANFGGNHSIVYDTTGLLFAGQPKGSPCMVVSVWIFKQLEWRNYPIGLTTEDLALSPEGLVAEIARVLEPETEKLIVPATSRMQVK